MLRHASEQSDLHLRPGVLEPRKLPQAMQHLLFGMLANRAGIEQDDVRILDAICIDVTRAAQNGANRLRIGDIHLASVSLEINPRTSRVGGAFIHKTKGNLRPRRHDDTTRVNHLASLAALHNRRRTPERPSRFFAAATHNDGVLFPSS